jgi:hypothetical protein
VWTGKFGGVFSVLFRYTRAAAEFFFSAAKDTEDEDDHQSVPVDLALR